MTVRKKIADSLFGNIPHKIWTIVLGLVASGIGMYIYSHWVQGSVTVIKDVVTIVERVERFEGNLTNHIAKERYVHGELGDKIEGMNVRLREIELLTAYLKGRSQAGNGK